MKLSTNQLSALNKYLSGTIRDIVNKLYAACSAGSLQFFSITSQQKAIISVDTSVAVDNFINDLMKTASKKEFLAFDDVYINCCEKLTNYLNLLIDATPKNQALLEIFALLHTNLLSHKDEFTKLLSAEVTRRGSLTQLIQVSHDSLPTVSVR